MSQTVYVIDDEQSICVALQFALKKQYRVKTFNSSLPALSSLEVEGADMVLLDLRLGEESGLDVLERIKKIDSDVQVIMMTAYGSIDTSVNAMRAGAFTYLTKPINLEELFVILEQAGTMRRMTEQIHYLSDELANKNRYANLIGECKEMQRIYMLIDRVKNLDTTVLITGESGTGKELVARAIHNASYRSNERFLVVNCATIPENLLELEFFGYKRGAFRGALQDKKGKLEQANNGTLFLDEIGDMSLDLQGKLLRVLEKKELTPIGGTQPVAVNMRIIAASNKDIKRLIREKRFREDLYYRLCVMEIKLPPLRERKSDIPLLCAHFLEKYAVKLAKSITGIDNDALSCLQSLDYPGNVRQLANIIEYACILSPGGVIHTTDFPDDVIRGSVSSNRRESIDSYLAYTPLHEIEKRAIEATLKRFNGKRVPTAEQLGISKRGLLNKLKEYRLELLEESGS